jgi:dipeptidyl-peptidase-4
MADRGYIVVAIDGRGTPGRGRDWERNIKGDLIALPLEDQASALIALGERYAELDLSRVGIHGWSFGGYFTAMALTRRPDLFRVGIVGAPVVAWEDYDTHYTERYMDLPQDNPEGYAAANVLTHADRLERPLLLVHGTADDNVYFLHSLKLVDALLRSGKEFDFLPLPGFTHMVPEPLVNRRLHDRMMELFDSQLKNE